MARKTLIEENEQQPLFDAVDLERPTRRQRNQSREPEGKPKRKTIDLFWWSIPFAAVAGVFVLTLAFHQVESFLINDARFKFAAPQLPGQHPPNLTIAGVRRAPRAHILRVFEKDLERSLYLFPAEERRRNLLAVPWVKDAIVARRWPNRVHVQIIEREPVAFAQIDTSGPPQFRLIDEEGVLLTIPAGEKFGFVVLRGMSLRDSDASRQLRVLLMMEMLREVGSNGNRISEVDVRDAANLVATVKMDDALVAIRLGNSNYRSRFENFLRYYPEIRQHRPDARLFELRVDDRITAVEERRGE